MRLYAVHQLSKGVVSRKLEELYNTSFKQICNWAHQFDEDGIDGLRDKPKSGRIPKLTIEQRTELKDILDSFTPEFFGYNTATWNGPVVIDFVKNKWAVEYKSAQIYNILHGLGFSFQRARGKFSEADKEKQAQFGEHIKKTSDGT